MTNVYLDTDGTRGYGRNRGFTLASLGIGPGVEGGAVRLEFFGRRGAINASVELSKDDAARLIRQLLDYTAR